MHAAWNAILKASEPNVAESRPVTIAGTVVSMSTWFCNEMLFIAK